MNKSAELAPSTDTIAGLRELYRAAEARAARLRLLSLTGTDLAQAGPENMDRLLDQCATRLAYFLGSRSAHVSADPVGPGIALVAPGPDERIVGRIKLAAIEALEHIADAEDREAARLCCEIIGATMDRIVRERDRNRLATALLEREQHLETLVGRIFSAQEDERRRVSQELHDGVAQTATALARMLEGAGGTKPIPLDEQERVRLARIARDLVGELRAVIGGLRPTLLDDLGIAAALQVLVDALAAQGFTASLECDGAVGRLDPLVETALFRVGQEAMANVRKHAGGPCEVVVELALGLARPRQYLRVYDRGNGPGADTRPEDGATGRHVGIAVMRERMAAIGGSLDWTAPASGGVEVTAWLPERN